MISKVKRTLYTPVKVRRPSSIKMEYLYLYKKMKEKEKKGKEDENKIKIKNVYSL